MVPQRPLEARLAWPKFGLLAALYLAQGVPFGFFTQALPVVMRQQAYSLELIGLSSLLALPWALKWAWAPLVDRYHFPGWGRRRSWLVALQLCTFVGLLSLAWLGDSRAVVWLLVGCFITNLLAATQDVAADGLAVEILSESERGFGNGIQVAGYRAGMILGGGVILLVFERWGWSLALTAMALVVLAAALPIFFHFEAPAPERASDAGGALLSFVKTPGVGLWLVLLLLYKGGDALATGMLRPFLVDRHLSLGDIGLLVGAGGSVTGLLGALAGGLLTRRLGLRLALAGFGLLSAVSVAGYAWAATSQAGILGLGVLVAVEHFTGGMATVALFTAMMSFCRRSTEGSDYTLQASVVVISSGLAHSMSGFAAARMGYPLHFSLSALLAGVVALSAYFWFSHVDPEGAP